MLDLLRNGLGWTEAAKGASALQCIELLYKATIKCLPQEVPAHQANYIALMELSASDAVIHQSDQYSYFVLKILRFLFTFVFYSCFRSLPISRHFLFVFLDSFFSGHGGKIIEHVHVLIIRVFCRAMSVYVHVGVSEDYKCRVDCACAPIRARGNMGNMAWSHISASLPAAGFAQVSRNK